MIATIKEEFLKDPDKLVDFFSEFGFERIRLTNKEIRMARDIDGGQNISVRLENNEYLCVNDWSRSVSTDIFSYIVQEKNTTFREVLQAAKRILGLQADWRPKKTYSLFGGIYENLNKPKDEQPIRTYPEMVLQAYEPLPSLRWLSEGISLSAQKFYGVCFSDEENRICFPWRSPAGEIMAIKGRANQDNLDEEIPKYLYLLRNNISQSLFNYSECYEHLYGADKVFVFESEKSCMKAFGWDIKNTVAIGSHSLSSAQVKLLLQLQVKEICLMLDSDLPLNETKKNADMIKKYATMRDIKITYWNWHENLDLPSKSAPVDGTFEEFKWICENEIYDVKELEDQV